MKQSEYDRLREIVEELDGRSKATDQTGQFGHIKQMDIGDSVAVRDEKSANIFHSYANRRGWGVSRRQVDEGDGAFEYRIWRVK